MNSNITITAESKELPLDQLVNNPDNPRQATDSQEDENLTNSLALHGLLNFILVLLCNGKYLIVDGHRRVAAALRLGWVSIWALVLPENTTPTQLKAYSLILNLRRADLNPMDRSDALYRLKEEHGLNLTQLGEAVSEKLPILSKYLRVQDLHQEAKELLRSGYLTFVKAYELACMPMEEQTQLLQRGLVKRTTTQTPPVAITKRVVLPVASGTRITVTGRCLSLEEVLLSLEYVLKAGRKYKSQGTDVTTFGKLLQDQAKKGQIK